MMAVEIMRVQSRTGSARVSSPVSPTSEPPYADLQRVGDLLGGFRTSLRVEVSAGCGISETCRRWQRRLGARTPGEGAKGARH